MYNMVHACIKCRQQYESEDADAYYCPECNDVRLRIAREIDAKVKARPSKRAAPSFDEKMAQFQHFKGIPIINLPTQNAPTTSPKEDSSRSELTSGG